LTKQNNLMTSISTQALYNPYFNLQTTSQFPQHFHSLGYTSTTYYTILPSSTILTLLLQFLFYFFFRLHTYVPQENTMERKFVSKILGKTREIVLFSGKSGKCCPFRKFKPEWKSAFVFSAENIFLFGFIVTLGVHSNMIANIVFS